MRDDTKWLNEVKVTPQTTNNNISIEVSTYLGTINGLSTSSTEWRELYDLLVTKLTDRVSILVSKQAQTQLDTNNGNIYTTFTGRVDSSILSLIQMLSDKCNKYENMMVKLHERCIKSESIMVKLHERCTTLESVFVAHAADFGEWGDRVASLEKANPNLGKYATMIQKNFKLYIFKKRIKEMAQLYRLQQKFQTMTEPKDNHTPKGPQTLRSLFVPNQTTGNVGRKAAEDRIYKENNRGITNNASRDPNDWTVEKAAMMSKLWLE